MSTPVSSFSDGFDINVFTDGPNSAGMALGTGQLLLTDSAIAGSGALTEQGGAQFSGFCSPLSVTTQFDSMTLTIPVMALATGVVNDRGSATAEDLAYAAGGQLDDPTHPAVPAQDLSAFQSVPALTGVELGGLGGTDAQDGTGLIPDPVAFNVVVADPATIRRLQSGQLSLAAAERQPITFCGFSFRRDAKNVYTMGTIFRRFVYGTRSICNGPLPQAIQSRFTDARLGGRTVDTAERFPASGYADVPGAYSGAVAVVKRSTTDRWVIRAELRIRTPRSAGVGVFPLSNKLYDPDNSDCDVKTDPDDPAYKITFCTIRTEPFK